MRRLHSLAGLIGMVVVLFMAITGAILSVQPALEVASAPAIAGAETVAALAGKVTSALPAVERITRSASGTIVAYFTDNGAHAAARIDPASGEVLGAYAPSGFFSFVTELHRSLFLGDAGHAIAGIGSVGIALLAVSGILLLATRMGGWRRLFARTRGSGAQRLHTSLARVAVFGLALTALTGAYMSAVNFGFVPDGTSLGLAFPPSGAGGTPAPLGTLQALADTPLKDLRELLIPANDPGDVITLTTATGQGYVDQATGALLSFTPNSFWQGVYETIYMLHTGDGLWWLGLILGAAALAVPAMAASGLLIWWRRRQHGIHIPGKASWWSAETVILVGSETNATLSYAATLHQALAASGERVHTAPMNSLRTYPAARRLIVLAATYGDGDPPRSASCFLSRLARLETPPAAEYAVLGFGDRSFAHYCAYAESVEAALRDTGMRPLLPFDTIDRQSDQDFAAWGRRLGGALGVPLTLDHAPVQIRTSELVLRERTDYGEEVQAPISVLRFGPAARAGWLGRLIGKGRLPRFEVGDLVGIVAPGSVVPRFYSLASSSDDGVLEICVRKWTGGLCSEFLHGLAPGAKVEAFVRPNRGFRPSAGRKPLILIGAGSGVAPLTGFIRENRGRRPAYLFFGARDPKSDFLYHRDLDEALAEGRLTKLVTAFSRVVGGGYVQDRLRADADLFRQLIGNGAEIFVCGGREMARGVRTAIDELLAPAGLSAVALKADGRYFEDAY